jgi:hypothetical protein
MKSNTDKSLKKQTEDTITNKFMQAVTELGHDAQKFKRQIKKASKLIAKKIERKLKKEKSVINKAGKVTFPVVKQEVGIKAEQSLTDAKDTRKTSTKKIIKASETNEVKDKATMPALANTVAINKPKRMNKHKVADDAKGPITDNTAIAKSRKPKATKTT